MKDKDDERRKSSQFLRRVAEQVEAGDVESVIVVIMCNEDDVTVYMDGVQIPEDTIDFVSRTQH